MTRNQRSLLYVGAGLVTGIVIAFIALMTMSRTQFGMDRVRGFAIGWLAERVDGEVHVGSIGGRGLLGGVTIREFYITDKHGRPFMRMDSVTLSYNWRTLARGQIVLDNAVLYHPEINFEQLPGDTVWNYQHVFPDRSEPGATRGPRRLIMINDARIVNGTATVRMPHEADEDVDTERMVIDTLQGGLARVMLFDSLHGQLSRVIWESPSETGRLFDVRSLRGRSFVWRDPMHVTGMRGTVTMRDTIVAFDMPDVRLQSSRGSMVGRVIMEEGLNFYDINVTMPTFTFSDLQWLYPRLPENGGGSGTLLIQSQRPRGVLWLAKDVKLAAPGTRVSGSFGVVTGADSLYFTNVDLRASPLDLDLIQSMLPNRLPLDGLLVGTVEVKGGLSSLETKGDMQLGSSGVKWRGTLDVSNGLAARSFSADLKTLDLAIVRALRPQLNVRGQLTGHVEASGGTQRSVKFAADIHHYLSGYTSSFAGNGSYERGNLELEMNASPLSLEEIAKTYPALERLKGEARGPIRLSGALEDLAFNADLETDGGRALVAGRLTRNERPRYTGDATLYSFRLDQLIADLPATLLAGKVTFDVTGGAIGDVAGKVSARLSRAEIRGLDFLDTHAAMTLESGAARIDTLTTHTPLGSLTAAGHLSLTPSRTDTLTFQLHHDSTTGVLRADGTLTGSPGAFDLAAALDITNFNVTSVSSDRVSARITATDLGSELGLIEVRGRADSVTAFGERADTAAFAIVYGTTGGGNAAVHGGSRNGDEYVANAGLSTTDRGLLFSIFELRLGQAATPWRLASNAGVLWDAHGFSADSIEVRREDGGRVRAAGRIAWHDGTHTPEADELSDFRLDFEGVPFAEFALATVGAADMRGLLNGSMRVTGNAVAPLIGGSANISGFTLGDASLDQLGGSFTYADRKLRARVDAEKAGTRVMFADGTIPLDLAFTPVAERRLAQPLRFSADVENMPALFATAMLQGFSDVGGRLDGTLLASGTTLDPQVNGSLTLRDGDASWLISGVRYRDVAATLRLENNHTARVEATAMANGGSARVTGTIDLKRPRDPGLALTLDAKNFMAAKRRDAELTATGTVTLGGRYRQPVVTGMVNVDHGTLFLDEIYRRFLIVELENPLLYDVVDTSLVSLPSILRTQNPFVRNLTIRDLRVAVGRESWLRSRDLNVEVAGDLTVAFLLSDTVALRTAQDLRLTGILRTARGTYQLAGPGISRRFALREGTIEFPGTPGVDPGLALNAVYRARSSRRDEPIDIIAVVGGTLRSPHIRLTSDDENLISESDLASYLFFGVPTYELTASQSEAVSQATAGFSFAASSGFGYLANSLQTVAQNFGLLDYVSLTAAEAQVGIQSQGAIASLFAGTRLELGRYVGSDGQIYIAYSQSLTANGYRRPGVRVEWQLKSALTGEVFVEDRFARTPDFGIQNLSQKRVYGLSLFREWAF